MVGCLHGPSASYLFSFRALQRREVVTGAREPTDEECHWSGDEGEEEEEEGEEGQDGAKKEDKQEAEVRSP